jgi:hypothetical protein
MEMRYPAARGERAAYWYLKLQEPDISVQEIQAALAWQADPDNYAGLMRVQSFLQAWSRYRPRPGSGSLRLT